MTPDRAWEQQAQWLRVSTGFLVVAAIIFFLIGAGVATSWFLFCFGFVLTVVYFLLLTAANGMRERIKSGEFDEEDQATRNT